MTIKLAQEAKAQQQAQAEARKAPTAGAASRPPLKNQVTLHLVSGDWITGELVRETPEGVILRWEYGEVGFQRQEIAYVERLGDPVEVVSAAEARGAGQGEVTLHLRNGGVVSGALIHENSRRILLRLEGGDVEFLQEEILRLEKGTTVAAGTGGMTIPWEDEHKKQSWPHQHDVVVKLMKGTVADGRISRVTPAEVVVTQSVEGGGSVEHTLQRSEIECLLFKPLPNERAAQIEKNLETLFPKMQWYRDGLFTILTDSIPPVAKEYRKTVQDVSTEWYLTFHSLLKERVPQVPLYVVIFENWDSYIEYAATDGIPGWLAVGYYHPEDQVLYCFNMLGERFADLLEEVYLGQFRAARDRVSQQIQASSEAIFIEGQMSEFLKVLESAHAKVRQVFRQISVDILRHELTHALFADWQLQGVILSQMDERTKDELENKRRFLQSGNEEERRQLLDALLKQAGEREWPQMRAANSWVVEGSASWMEPSPVAGVNTERLAQLQEARRSNALLPLAYLDTFRMGSFLALSPRKTMYAYAQSWALCHFLMQRYPEAFFRYLQRLATENPAEGTVTLNWLLDAVGRDAATFEQEFLAYVDSFPPVDSVLVKQMQDFLDARQELTRTAQRLWQ
jgi:hypothetical protein